MANSSNRPGKGGGSRQRKAISDAAVPVNIAVKSEQAESLVHDWAWGKLSPQSAQATAAMALRDIDRLIATNKHVKRVDFGYLADLEAIAAIGAYGHHPNHCHKEMVSLVGGIADIPRTEIKVPLKIKPGGNVRAWVSQTFVLPHVLFAWIFANCQKSWKARVCPGRDTLERFWTSQADHPSMTGHPMRGVHNWKRRAVPISLHGDDVPVTGCGKVWSKSMRAISWCSMLGTGSTVNFNFLIFAVFTAITYGGFGPQNTNKRIFQIIAWSLYWLYLGMWPTSDVDGDPINDERAGTPLAGLDGDGFFGVLWGIKGDLEYLAHVP